MSGRERRRNGCVNAGASVAALTSVSGTLYGSKTLVYNDDNRLTSMTYGGVTDLYYYTYAGLR
jgi:hypothetical protein